MVKFKFENSDQTVVENSADPQDFTIINYLSIWKCTKKLQNDSKAQIKENSSEF